MNEEDVQELVSLVPSIRRYTLFLTRYNTQDADDLLQDTLVRAIENGEQKYVHGTNLKAWVMRIAHNRFMDTCRRTAIRSEKKELLEATATPLSVPSNPEQAFEFKEVFHMFEELPDKYRRALFLVAVEQFDYREAADILAVPIGTVKSRVARARAILKSGVEGNSHADLASTGAHVMPALGRHSLPDKADTGVQIQAVDEQEVT